MPRKFGKSPFDKLVDSVREAVKYDLVMLKFRTYLTSNEQSTIAILLAILTIGIVKKYFFN